MNVSSSFKMNVNNKAKFNNMIMKSKVVNSQSKNIKKPKSKKIYVRKYCIFQSSNHYFRSY